MNLFFFVFSPKSNTQHHGNPAQQQQQRVTVYGGRRLHQQPRGFFYGGPENQEQVNPCAVKKIPTFEELVKNRVMRETRFFANKSNAKWLSLGIVPATKILNDAARGFFFEAYLCGDKCIPMPLGGISGLAGLFDTIRQLPTFQHHSKLNNNIEASDNITISSCEFSEDVCD